MVGAWGKAAALVLAATSMGAGTAQDLHPQVRMAAELVAAASAFETFTTNAAGIEAGFRDGGSVADALKVGAAYEARQLQTGMTAFVALAALQEPAFVAGVRRAAQAEGAEALAERMRTRPDLALYLPAADLAAARAAAALADRAEPLRQEGQRVKQAAYDVQRQAWSKRTVPDAAGRLMRVKQISAAAFQPSNEDGARLMQAITTRGASYVGAPGPVVQRGLALAALALVDRAGAEDAQAALALAEEPASASCVRVAKLNLYQCLAVAGPHYEDIFCLGEHAMIEPAKCVAKAAGASPVPEPPPARPLDRSLLVPVAAVAEVRP